MSIDDELDSLFDEPQQPQQPKQNKQNKKDKIKKEDVDSAERKLQPQQPVPPSIPSAINDEFDVTPDTHTNKSVITIYGKKGDGKTYLAFTTPGTHSCISFDRKSQRIAALPEFSTRITVYDGLRYMDKTTGESWLESSTRTWKYVQKILERIEEVDKPDWIVIDGGEIIHTIFEMVMRDRNNIRPFQGIANKNIWKYRRMLIDQLLTRCTQIAKIGVIWTSYVTEDKIMEEGDYVAIREVPKWIDAVLYETDSLIRVSRMTTKNGQKFMACVQSSKWDALKNGPRIDVTNIGMKKLLSKEYLEKFESDGA